MMKKLLAVFGVVVMGLLIAPVRAGSPNDVVIEGVPYSCESGACGWQAGFRSPHFLGVDPATGTFAPDRPDALVKQWDVSPDGATYTFTLREDWQWSDGQPVNAYDALYTVLLNLSQNPPADPMGDLAHDLTGIQVEGSNRLALTFRHAACSSLDLANFLVLPAHQYRVDFAELAEDILKGADTPQTALKNLRRLRIGSPDTAASTITAGGWHIEQAQAGSWMKFAPTGAGPAYLYRSLPSDDAVVEGFISGDLNFIQNPPFDRRDDVRAVPGVQVAEYPGLNWDYIGFNLADPKHPRNAYDKDGKPVDQGHHPLFGDLRVRQALQQAINVPELIAAAVQGDGTPIAANQLPTSWAFNADLKLTRYDPAAAKALLQEAGWFDVNGDRVIECYQCQYAKNGTPFTFTLLVDGGYPRLNVEADLIQRQLQPLGIVVNIQGGGDALRSAMNQTYDAYLTSWRERYPINPDQSRLFTTADDVVGKSFNSSSYANPEVDKLFEQANSVPGCSAPARADLYRQALALVQRDQPYLWLFAVNDMVAAKPTVKGFKPYSYAPLWNIDQWQVYSEIN
jgi:ABC-type transport system substrate-binding protein